MFFLLSLGNLGVLLCVASELIPTPRHKRVGNARTEFIHTKRLQSRLPIGLNGLRYDPKLITATRASYLVGRDREPFDEEVECIVLVHRSRECGKVLERLGTTESTRAIISHRHK